jgi:multimeric flavodoxin WrbA
MERRKILALNGSPRPSGNTVRLLEAFADGVEKQAELEIMATHDLDIRGCTGCLRCNVLKRCSLSGDGWPFLAQKILEAHVLVVAAPVYFHHLPASMKAVLDRFRSFAHVQITEHGLVHTPHQEWNKDFVLLLSQGSPDPSDAQPVIDLFTYICRIMGKGNRLHTCLGTRLAMVNQVSKSGEELEELYGRLGLPGSLAQGDHQRNRELLERCRTLGSSLSGRT